MAFGLCVGFTSLSRHEYGDCYLESHQGDHIQDTRATRVRSELKQSRVVFFRRRIFF
jgi:hypothetical protein